MPRNKSRTLAKCPYQKVDEPNHEVILTWDHINNEYFVACMTCGCEGMRCKDIANAKGKWTQRQKVSREPERTT